MTQDPAQPHRWSVAALGKLFLRLIILALVLWGVWRATGNALDELRRRAADRKAEITRLRGLIEQAADESPEKQQWRARLQRLASQDVSPWSVNPFWLTVAGLLYLAGLAPNWLFWRQTLLALGAQPGWLASLRAYYIGHLGKYVPGKAMVVVLRTGLLADERCGKTVTALAVFIETLTMMAVGGMVASLVLLWLFEHWLMLALALAMVAAAGAPTLPPVFRRVIRLLKLRRADPQIEHALEGLDFRLMTRGWLLCGGGWLLLGLSMWATVRGLPMTESALVASLRAIPLYTACVALAMVLGFVSLIPGGALVREWVITTLLAPLPDLGVAGALAAAVWLRIAWLVSELVISAILYLAAARSGGRS